MKNSITKLNHAKKILIRFEKEYKDFISKNYKLIKEEDKTTGGFFIKLSVKQQLPEEWGPIIGDIIHNTRSSLDLLITDLLHVNGKEPTAKSAFPIFETEKDFLKGMETKIEGITEEACEIIKKMRPYKEGNLKFWQLHKLDIIDKHRIILPVVNENKAVVIDFGEHMKSMFGDKVGDIPSMPIGIRSADREVHDGTILFKADKTHAAPKFEFELVFGKNDILAGESISINLNEFIKLVASTISECDSLLSV